MEVVIRPLPGKLEELGVKPKEWQALRHRRLVRGEWRTEIGGKEIDLGRVAQLTVRPLHVPPFTVRLPDGREAVVRPNRRRIGAYLVTGEFFEESVRDALAEPFVENPATVKVLGGIPVPGGNVPNMWGRDHVHISLGESLEVFASVKIKGR